MRSFAATLAAVCLTTSLGVAAEQSPPSPERLRVFIACASCDLDFLRQEITFIEYVRDRLVSDIHVIVASEPAGEGTAFTLQFIGRGRFDGLTDALTHVASPIDTEDETRRAHARLLALGLARYLARTPLAGQLNLALREANAARPAPEADRWNRWVFSLGVNGDLSGEELTRAWAVSGSSTASRTTEAWKLQMGASASYDASRFELDDESLTSTSRSSLIDGLAVKSLGRHWGAGIGGSIVSSTFTNQRGTFRAAPAVEVNLFPYSESSRRQVTFGYAVGVTALRYREETIFGRLRETQVDGRAHVFAAATQPWGTIDASLEARHVFGAPSQYRVLGTGRIEFQVAGGLYLDISGGASLLRDQSYLPRRGASDEEVLLRRRKLATGYDYFAGLGVTFTFGSVHDSIVNSRLSGARRGFIRRY